jgi:hypothetical protein
MPKVLNLPVTLQPVDYAIAELLDEHDTFTTTQLAHMLFNSVHTCRRRLYRLFHLEFLLRYIRRGDDETIGWTPGFLSSRYVALQNNQRPPSRDAVAWRTIRAYARWDRPLAHEANGFFVRLIRHARSNPDTALVRWWSPKTITEKFGDIRSRGHGVWRDGDREVGFFLFLADEEWVILDREPTFLGQYLALWTLMAVHDQIRFVEEELHAQKQLREQGGPAYPLLIVFRDQYSESAFHDRFQNCGFDAMAATTELEGANSPLGRVWKLLDNVGRHRLADLPSSHRVPGPRNPGAPTESDDPLSVLKTGQPLRTDIARRP